MKPHRGIGMVLAAAACALVFWAVAAGQKSTQQEVLLQKAIQIETVDGDMTAAIKLYQQILATPGGNRSVAAKAQLHLGFCYEKSGLKQAQEAFQRVIDQYPEQADAVKAAKDRLSALLGARAPVEKGGAEYKVTKFHSDTRLGWLSPDGTKLVVIDYNKNILSLRNIANGKEVDLLPAPELITDCFWSPDSRLIAYYAGSGNIRLISAGGGQPRTIIEIDPEMEKAGKYAWPMGWTTDSKKLVFQVSTRKTEEGLYAVPVSGGKWEEIYKFPDPVKAKERAERLTLSPDGKWIAYPSKQNGNQDIYVMPVLGGEPMRITDDPANDSGPLWSYDGQWLAFRSSRTGVPALWVIRITPDGKPGSQPLLAARGADSATWTHDGRIAYTTESGSSHIFAANVDGTQERKLTRVNNLNFAPRWSPDGKNIAYLANYGESPNRFVIWTVPANGGDEKLLAFGGLPAWSPDGKMIAFCNELSRVGWIMVNGTISIVPASGGEAKQIMNYGGSVTDLDWSPDGTQIVFSYNRVKDGKNPIPDSRESARDIYTIPVTGGEPKRIIRIDNQKIGLHSPRWSPDGKKIAYFWMNAEGADETGNLAEPSRLYTINVNGGEPKLVTNETPRYWFCWSRDSAFILFSKASEDKNLYRVPADGGKAEKLNVLGKAPDVSPDGKKIVYYRTSESRFDFWLAENFLQTDKKEK